MTDNDTAESQRSVYRVDKFIVPEAGRDEFLARARMTEALLQTLPGFRSDLLLEQSGGSGKFNFITLVELAAYSVENARQAAAVLHRQENFDPAETIARLGITADQGWYQRLKF